MATETILYQTGFAKIKWLEEHQLIYLEWLGFANGEDYRRLHEKVLEMIIRQGAKMFVQDMTQMEIIAGEDIDWTISYWHQQLARLGIRQLYAVEPQKAFGKISSRKLFYREFIQQFQVRFFLDKPALSKFLESQHKPV